MIAKTWAILLFFAVLSDGQGTRMNPNQIDTRATFAHPPAHPAPGSVWTFTDTAAPGVCQGGGSSLSMCEWTGSAYVPFATSGTATAASSVYYAPPGPGAVSVTVQNALESLLSVNQYGTLAEAQAASVAYDAPLVLANGSVSTGTTLAMDYLSLAGWGDSYTSDQQGVPVPSGSAWTDILSSISGFTVVNEGVGGQSSTQILARYLADTTHQNWAQVFEMGVNNGTSYTGAVADMATAVAQAQSNSAYYIVSPLFYNITVSPSSTQGLLAASINSGWAATYGTHFANWWSGAPITYQGVIYSNLLSTYNASNPIDVYHYNNGQLSTYVRAPYNLGASFYLGAAITTTTQQVVQFCGYTLTSGVQMEVLIDTEDMLVTAGASNGCGGFNSTSITRAYAGTTAATHLINAQWQGWDVVHLNSIGYGILAAYYAKNLSLYANALLDVSDAGTMIQNKLTAMLTNPVTFQNTVAVLGTLCGGGPEPGAPANVGVCVGLNQDVNGWIQTYNVPLYINPLGNGILLGKSDGTTTTEAYGAFYATGTVSAGGAAGVGLTMQDTGSLGTIQTYAHGLTINAGGNNTSIGKSDNSGTETFYGAIGLPGLGSSSGGNAVCWNSTTKLLYYGSTGTGGC